jgi:Cd2+/Zn2+-exporting ATPase
MSEKIILKPGKKLNIKKENIIKNSDASNIKREFILEGLDCANCASKIESRINKLSEVKNATVNFATKKLTIQFSNINDAQTIIEKSKTIIKALEPDVSMVSAAKKKDKSVEEENEEKSLFKEYGLLIAGAIVFSIVSFINMPSYIKLIMYVLSYLAIGGEVVLKALKNIAKGEIFDENFLMVVATLGAFAIKEYPEAVAVMLFYQVGEFFQDMAVNKSRKSIGTLMNIRPDYANLKVGDELKKVDPDEIEIGDIILVKPGEKIPLDGVVVKGESSLDTAALTGEAIPRDVAKGDNVLSGCVNKNGILEIAVTKAFGDSTASKILDLVENASSKKAKAENFITKFAKYYTPIVVGIAVLLAIVPPLVIEGATFQQYIYNALVFLVVSCPCALVISIPLSFFGGIGGASKRGILVKGGNYLEDLNNASTIVFDKTGTLTEGAFGVSKVEVENGYTNDEVLEYAAYAESFSNHPIAVSIVKAYNKQIDKKLIEKYEEVSGFGTKIILNGKQVLVGNEKLLKNQNIKFKPTESVGTIVYVALDNNFIGAIIINDKIKKDSKKAIESLKRSGIKNIYMLTGDNRKVAENVGTELGIDKVYSELLPKDKVDKVEEIFNKKQAKEKIVFVGDGINDAPVLARADIGIAMGGVGSDAAIEAADVVIMTDEPSKIAEAIKIAKKTRVIVLQNIVFALGVKIAILIMGALGFATMWEAVFADVGVALIAVLNAMRALKVSDR